MKNLKRRIAVISVSFILLFVLSIYSFNQLVPIVNVRAAQYSRSHATKIINTAVGNVLEDDDYDALVDIKRDAGGNIIALSADISRINSLKSKVSAEILEILSESEQRALKIPIGNLSGLYILSGRGFGLSVRLIPTDSITAVTESSFSEVGINQSRHEIWLKVTLRLGVIILGRHNSVEVSDRILIADTVIVGKVPDAYTDIEKVDDDTLGEIVDFKAVK